MAKNSIVSTLKVLALALILSVGVSYVLASAPVGGPPNCPTTIDACNGPVHTGATSQTKVGPLWADIIGSNGNAYINGRLGIAIGAANPVAANLDVAGTVRFRGDSSDAASLPAVGKVLTAINANGDMKWQTPSSNLQMKTGWYPFAYNTVCSAVCKVPITFPTPFPVGTQPVVTAQPMWVTSTNNETTSWAVSDITNTGFSFVYHSPAGADSGAGDTGMMWTAIYDPANDFSPSSFKDMSCRTEVVAGVSYPKTVKWYLTVPYAVPTLKVKLMQGSTVLTVFPAANPKDFKTIANASRKVENLIGTATLNAGTYVGTYTVIDGNHPINVDPATIECTAIVP